MILNILKYCKFIGIYLIIYALFVGNWVEFAFQIHSYSEIEQTLPGFLAFSFLLHFFDFFFSNTDIIMLH
jgi:hypothetical protein